MCSIHSHPSKVQSLRGQSNPPHCQTERSILACTASAAGGRVRQVVVIAGWVVIWAAAATALAAAATWAEAETAWAEAAT